MAKHLQAFQQGTLDVLADAIQNRDWAIFEREYRRGIESANRFHTVTNHPEIRWKLPEEPPLDLDLGPGAGDPAE